MMTARGPRTKRMIKALIFDLGGVIIPLDFQRGYAAIERASGYPAADIPKKLASTDLLRRYETGQTGTQEFVADTFGAATEWYAKGSSAALDGYSATCLRRVWRAEHFSWLMTTMLHRHADDPFMDRLGLSNLRYVISSRSAARTLAENYVGL